VLEEAGFEPGENPSVNTRGERSRSSSKPRPTASFNSDLDLKSIDQLYEEMQRASENENYEEAARIKAEIELRKNKGESDAPGERDIPF
jgi:excinuclease UvrABC helicase subunit UvrB